MSGDSEKAPETWPQTLALSNNVNVKIGFNTDRAKVAVRTGLPWPVPKEVYLWLEPDDVPRVEAVIEAYKKWLALPKAQREFTGESE